jgi:NAD(P)-dependent dehydrogenase (short-subunit alcohol dehydrogenase family)
MVALQWFVILHGNIRCTEFPAQRCQILYQQRHMRLACRSKIRLYAEMQLQIATLEPTAASFCQIGRLHNLRNAQKPTVEAPSQLFTADGHRQLYMLDLHDLHTGALYHGTPTQPTDPIMKNVLITGGGRGIGRATALLCAKNGWSVSLNYVRDEKAAAETVSAVEAAGGKARSIKADVAVESDVIALFDAAEKAFGKIDGVVVNAGIVAPSMQLADMSAERLQKMFEVNVFGAYLCARECARRMSTDRGGQGGSVVLVSSAASRLGSPFEFVDYAGSKGAIDTLAIGLAKELGKQGVRVNAVRPGLIDTEIHASAGQPDRAHRLGGGSPLGRAGRAEEVAAAIVWLLSDAASYTTGALLDVSGGR